jgi:outer membrane protein assembly factor BamE (lipoprotein component of BamABCDE complex)
MTLPQSSTLVANKIKIGMSRAEVLTWLGSPQRAEIHGTTEFLFYTPTWQFALASVSLTPIAIRDGKVVGMGSSYYQSAVKG